MTAYYKVPYTALILTAGLATALPMRNYAQVFEANATNATQPQNRGVSLDKLVSDAEIILVGEVVQAVSKNITVLDQRGRVPIPTEEVILKIVEGFKGKLRKGDPLVVTMYEPTSVRVGNGEKLLWYLSPKFVYGFQAPLQTRPGYFLIKPDEEFGQLTHNLDDNRGLWSEDEPLFGSLNEKELARQYLLDRQVPRDRADRIISIGDGPCCPKNLPLDLVLAATHAKVASNSPAPSQR